jgi:hypothetical protein
MSDGSGSSSPGLGVDRCLRILAETLTSLLLLSSIALAVPVNLCLPCKFPLFSRLPLLVSLVPQLCSNAAVSVRQSFGAFMLYEWKHGDETQALSVPGYIYLVLFLGLAGSLSNALSYCGACSRSICLLSASLFMVLVVLLLEAALAGVLFYDPALIDTKVCPPDDSACLDRIDNLFKNPSAHAGVVVSIGCGGQALTLFVLLLLRRSTRLRYNSENNVDTIFWERGGLRRSLLEEQEWQNSRDEFEERA